MQRVLGAALRAKAVSTVQGAHVTDAVITGIVQWVEGGAAQQPPVLCFIRGLDAGLVEGLATQCPAACCRLLGLQPCWLSDIMVRSQDLDLKMLNSLGSVSDAICCQTPTATCRAC